MGGQDDHVSGFGDWRAPSARPRTFFLPLLGNDLNSRSILENNDNMLFSSEENIMSKNNDNDKSSGGLDIGEYTKLDMYSQQKMNSRGGLVERMAARAGFNAPKLNTKGVRPDGISQNQDSRSTFLTIPPGLSPTTLLESPVFLSDALAQPSPTTGKFPFALGGFNNRNFSLAPENPVRSLENFYGDVNASSFAFKPILESEHSFFLGPTNNNFPGFEASRAVVASTENSSPRDAQQDDHQEPLPGGSPAEDGYNWRKYGQKQVKGSEYPRSYYKCTHPNCPVKKKVERSYEGHITEIIYKGSHTHPKPPTSRRSGSGMILDTQTDIVDRSGEVTSSGSVGAENYRVENSDMAADRFSAVSTGDNEEEDDRATHESASLGFDGEEDESESKRRKIEAYAAEMSGATRAIREARVVVQTTSEVDILDDGYRWRKYGQKIVKGNPNPRSYYKCTHPGCTVRKHVERASNDLKSVITTYEGKHIHEVPAARNNSHQASAHGPTRPTHLHRTDPAQSHNLMGQFGPSHGYSFGLGQMPVMPPHQYLGQLSRFDGMGFVLPRGEPQAEHLSEAPMNFPNGYYQMMNRMPRGP